MAPKLVLEGIRILDLGMFWAGPYAGGILADMGAEVIKVESCRRPDPLRIQARGLYPNGEPGERSWNRSGMINDRARNKYGITLDLSLPQGRDVFKRLVKISDVVLENFSRRVVRNLELEYPLLREVNPAIILLSLSSQGLIGPEKDNVSFGPTLEQIGGLASLTGYSDEMSSFASYAYPDALAGMLGAGSVIAALRSRRRTGQGMHIDLSQRELTTSIIGETLMDYAMNGRIHEPIGNRDSSKAPCGCYPCQGKDEWVTIVVASDEEWASLCQVMGREDLVNDSRFADVISRWKNQDEIDRTVSEWTRKQDHYQIMNRLQETGIAAGAVLTVAEIFDDVHMKERDFFPVQTHPEAGTFLCKGKPMRFSKTPLRNDMPAPCLGEHNTFVYGTLLGMSQEEIDGLEREGVIGTVPTSTDLQFT